MKLLVSNNMGALAYLLGWLVENGGGNKCKSAAGSFCKVCETPLRSHKSDLIKHAGTERHKLNMSKIAKSQKNIMSYGKIFVLNFAFNSK